MDVSACAKCVVGFQRRCLYVCVGGVVYSGGSVVSIKYVPWW